MKNKNFKVLIIILSIIFSYSQNIFAQLDTSKIENNGYITIDSTNKFIPVEEITDIVIDSSYIKSPKKAALLSLVFPGLGQMYNRKYWKVPIVWGLLGVASYSVDFTSKLHNLYLNDYITVLKDTTNTQLEILGYSDVKYLIERKDKFRKYYDYSIIAWLIVYGLNILDANVDAHFSNFDISEDLTLNFSPKIIKLTNNNYTFGINLALYF